MDRPSPEPSVPSPATGDGMAAVSPTPGRTGHLPSWHARSGRLTARKRWALEVLAPRYAPAVATATPNPRTSNPVPANPALANRAPGPPTSGSGVTGTALALEIGAGTGEAALALARARPDWSVVAAEVHRASVATLLLAADDAGLPNLGVVIGDGRDVLAALGAVRPVALVRLFFPDPWPKHRHRARRIVGTELLDLLAATLAPDGHVEVATDDARYAAAIERLVAADARFRVLGRGRADRPLTYYERRALEEGRAIHDLQFGPVTPAGREHQ